MTYAGLTEFIGKCISPKNERPHARQLLKDHYFDTIKGEKCSIRLQQDALASSGSGDVLSDLGSSGGSALSRSSSVAGEMPPDERDLPVPSGGISRSRSHSPRGLRARADAAAGGIFSDEDDSVGTAADMSALADIEPLPHSLPVVLEDESGEGLAATDSDASAAAAAAATERGFSPLPHLFSDLPVGAGSRDTFSQEEGSEVEREFRVGGSILEEEDKLSLRLRIARPEGAQTLFPVTFAPETS